MAQNFFAIAFPFQSVGDYDVMVNDCSWLECRNWQYHEKFSDGKLEFRVVVIHQLFYFFNITNCKKESTLAKSKIKLVKLNCSYKFS